MLTMAYGLMTPLDIHRYLANNCKLSVVDKFSISSSFSFTFVRDPIKRAYSCFHEKIINKSSYSFPKIAAYIQDKYVIDLLPTDDKDQVEKQFYTFLKFIEDNINNNTDVRKDPHWLPQSKIIGNYNSVRAIDFIGRVEDFQKDMDFVLSKIGHTDLDSGKKFNEGPKPEVRLEEILSPRVRNIAVDLFGEDYVKFGYDLGDL